MTEKATIAVNHRVEVHDMLCCGLMELHRIHDSPKDPIANLLGIMSAVICGLEVDEPEETPPFVIFTQASPAEGVHTYGEQLAECIRSKKFGSLKVSPTYRNPNSGNLVTTYLWAPNWERMWEWYEIMANKYKFVNLSGLPVHAVELHDELEPLFDVALRSN